MSLTRLIQLKPDEKILAVYRQYGWTYAGSVVLAFVLLVLPFFLLTPLFARGPLGVAGFFVLLALGLFYSLRQAVRWYYNMFIVTDRRIVDVDQRGFFDRTVSEVVFQKIQDVSYRVKGVMPTLLHYGTVLVQTASGAPQVELRHMKDPERIVDLINEFREQGSPNTTIVKMPAPPAGALSGVSEEERRQLHEEVKQQSRDTALKEFLSTDRHKNV